MSPKEINAIQPRPQVGELPNGGKAITQSIQLEKIQRIQGLEKELVET